jgi:hypothetical protein
VRPQASGGKQVEGVKLTVPLPAATLSVALTVNYGSYEYDPVTKVRGCVFVCMRIYLYARGSQSAWAWARGDRRCLTRVGGTGGQVGH